MSDIHIDVRVEGLDEVGRIAGELQQSVEKTRALASALIKACNNLNIETD